MPTILRISGWRLFFYSNEGNEPVHVHARKGDMECKFVILKDQHNIWEDWSYNLNTSGRQEIRKIIFDHFDYIIMRWNEYFNYF
jgi:hypothetical protein